MAFVAFPGRWQSKRSTWRCSLENIPGRLLMPELAAHLPARRPELLIKPLGDEGRYVVKDPRTGAFFHLGEAEHFLLTQLDGSRRAEAVCAAYAERFGEPLSED